jgi:hypothetical protein
VLLLGEVLAPLAPSDEFFGVAQSCGPIESSSESLADQETPLWISSKMSLPSCLGTHFMSTPGDAPLVEIVSDEDVGLGAADELLSQVLV